MQTSVTPIYYTKEYKLFKFIKGNREINELKVKRIIDDIDNGLNMLKYCPIVVTEDLQIIDGQHRFTVSKILKEPVFYVIAKEISLSQIASINSRTERWKPANFVNCYAETGNKDYKDLQAFIMKYNLPVSSALNILTNGIYTMQRTPKIKKHFEEGTLKIRFMDEATRIIEYALRFKGFPGNTSGTFLDAISNLMKAGIFNEEVLINKFMANPDALTTQSGRKGYLLKLEEIYNFKNSKRQAIY